MTERRDGNEIKNSIGDPSPVGLHRLSQDSPELMRIAAFVAVAGDTGERHRPQPADLVLLMIEEGPVGAQRKVIVHSVHNPNPYRQRGAHHTGGQGLGPAMEMHHGTGGIEISKKRAKHPGRRDVPRPLKNGSHSVRIRQNLLLIG